jgi:cellulose synthase/poly-beta-1,6-N-acetylglucosamine synthase-like glycosyltransferase
MQLCALFPPPDPRLQFCVTVPARDEAAYLPRLVRALARQEDLAGQPLPPGSVEVLLLLNNCSDGTPAVARAFGASHPAPGLRVAEVRFEAAEAHMGRARQVLMDAALARFHTLARPDGLILTTDADTRPDADWIAAQAAEVARAERGPVSRAARAHGARCSRPSPRRRAR